MSDLGVSLPSLVDVSSTTKPGEYSGQDSVVNLPVSEMIEDTTEKVDSPSLCSTPEPVHKYPS